LISVSGIYFALKAMSRPAAMIGDFELGMADIKGKMHENARLLGGVTRRTSRTGGCMTDTSCQTSAILLTLGPIGSRNSDGMVLLGI
jgi:hypothetical protein